MSDVTNVEASSPVQAGEQAAKPQVAVMNLLAGEGPRADSPLAHAELGAIAKQSDAKGGVCLQELKLLGHLVLRGDPNNQSFVAGVTKVLGVALPAALKTEVIGELSVHWVSPDEWLLIMPAKQAFQLERELRAELTGHYAIVNVSGGQTVLRLTGPDVDKVLCKSTPYDVHERNFPVGKVVTSVFAKSQAVISRSGEEAWDLVVRRSFADYLWLWLQDASAEYGLQIKG
ncbi:sarcosine oxidase subunit gamma family protein [Dasania sp. GY-MA-18]|uniref:Sarcosine oxidase subunit gamma family protein n=1 Tax=Dasania phycosphaerae TaxID=2950436 RepID=A0A9J6RMI8_9GAMM|nr:MULTISPECIES: sarcosine oxidase subunit gamma family protein [Dasania]MCR8923508.1 sarcosine oxidase subunit gamma family protein [Dasania sp. GY-MA-18]MCZ0865942.1 sarcosine oxidase subunit gamma family protein [Dasania phycosphaerae]MCZ0869666.1 sarcosine oxidase subunit gamma family protein [Dasania phycosphaerae]